MDDSVITGRAGRIGRITLNRPRALNALDLPMIRAIAAALDGWRGEPGVHAVVIDAVPGRGFCAGGDIRALYEAARRGDAGTIETFFSEEYALNAAIAEYRVPVIALIDGVCMGGGVGISVHGTARVATENALIAMPETGIALFPDVGASYVLPRLPGELGMYLGLTGARLAGADAVHAGFATHHVLSAELPALLAALAEDGPAVLARFAAPLPAFSLAAVRPAIDRCFSAATVGEILERLEQEGEFGAGTLAALRAASPSAVMWTFGLLRRGAARDLRACLAAELRLTRAVTRTPDFLEGVRAMVIDKDRAPRWSPAGLEDVNIAGIAAMLGDEAAGGG